MLSNKKIKAFTIMELLVSMTLTGILVVFSFMGYNQIQKLFINYTVQNKFITDYNQLNKALFILSNNAHTIQKYEDESIVFKSDSNVVSLQLNDKNLLLKFKNHTDTFDLVASKKVYNFVELNAEINSNLIEYFECQVYFQNQKFTVSFHKQYDAFSILNKNLEIVTTDELY